MNRRATITVPVTLNKNTHRRTYNSALFNLISVIWNLSRMLWMFLPNMPYCEHGAHVHGPEDMMYGDYPMGAEYQEPIFYAKKVKFAKILFEHGLRLDLEEKKEQKKEEAL